MEAKKFQDVWSGSWRPRRADGVVLRLKANSLETKKELMFQLESKGKKEKTKLMSQLKAVRNEDILS
jgi:hypothetical protein